MALNNNTVQIIAGLLCTQLTSPQIGSQPVTFLTGFTDGDPALDEYYVLSTTALDINTALSGSGSIFVANQSAIDVQLLIKGAGPAGADVVLGTLKGVSSAESGVNGRVIPIDSGVIIRAKAASGTPTIGVTVIKHTPNA